MCKAFEDYKLEGIQEGIQVGIQEYLVTLVCKKMQKGMETAVIAEMLEEEQEVIERIVEVQRKIGGYDVAKICETLRESSTDPMCFGKGM